MAIGPPIVPPNSFQTNGAFGHSVQIFKVVGRIQRSIAMKFVQGAMNLIRAAANNHIHYAAGILPAIRARVRADDDLLNCVQRKARRRRRRISTFVDGGKIRRRVGIGNAVDVEAVRARRASR